MHTIQTWHQVLKTKDTAGLANLLADNVVFHSPVVHTPQVGKAITYQYLTAAFQVFGDPSFRYVREVVGATDAMLEFELEIEGVRINGVDLIAWNGEGKIIDFKVMIRPLKAVNMIHQQMGAMLAAHSKP
jgi:SnoaL-like domain